MLDARRQRSAAMISICQVATRRRRHGGMARIFNWLDFTWTGDQLFVGGKSKPVAEVVRDTRYVGMWRFRLLPGGELSDMVNLSRAKDAARLSAASSLNTQISRHVAA